MNNDSWRILTTENLLKNTKGASMDQIVSVEKKLNVRFDKEYREFLLKLGACIYDGHEIVGISQFPDMNVLDATISARELRTDIPSNWYVIEDTHFDGILIWQDEKGVIYQTVPNKSPTTVSESLHQYLGFEE